MKNYIRNLEDAAEEAGYKIREKGEKVIDGSMYGIGRTLAFVADNFKTIALIGGAILIPTVIIYSSSNSKKEENQPARTVQVSHLEDLDLK